jgi:spermidine synthase
MSHAAIFTHAAPKDIVIIGGGDCGTLRECLKHAEVETIVQCDIDEQVTRMAEKYFPELCESNNDPRATVMFDDGIAYMAAAEPESIDIIIVDSTDPVGPAEGLFNRAFYETCFKALRPEGLLVQQSESPLALMNLIQDMIAAMADAGFRGFRTLPFPQPCYPTGWWSCTIAAKNGRDLTTFRNDAAAISKPRLQGLRLGNFLLECRPAVPVINHLLRGVSLLRGLHLAAQGFDLCGQAIVALAHCEPFFTPLCVKFDDTHSAPDPHSNMCSASQAGHTRILHFRHESTRPPVNLWHTSHQ